MELLEREDALLELGSAVAHAVRGDGGRVALVFGEAGIGKTALVEHFARVHRPACRILWGACDPLFTPRPFGPLHDIAAQLAGDLSLLLREHTDRAAIFSALLAELQAQPAIAYSKTCIGRTRPPWICCATSGDGLDGRRRLSR